MRRALLRILFLAAALLLVGGALALTPMSLHAATPLAQDDPAGSAEAQIRDVIVRANAQQEQAIRFRDSAVMQDTSTERYYREMIVINRSLLQNEVTSIVLVDIEWGTISVIGDTATAVTDETWAATFADGTTRQSRDRNLYQLVRQDGRWLIEANEHPDDRTPLMPGDRQV